MITYSNGLTTPDKINVFADVWYQCYSNNSFISQISVRRSVHCAGQCLRNPNCQTATFDQGNHVCSLYTELKELGQLIQKSEAFIFERQRKYAFGSRTGDSGWLYAENEWRLSKKTYSTAQPRTSTTSTISTMSTTSTTSRTTTTSTTSSTTTTSRTSRTTTAHSTTRSPCINVTIPSNADGWICANATVSLTGGTNRIFYCEEGSTLTVFSVSGSNTLYLKTGVTFSADGGDFTGYSTGFVSTSESGNGGISMTGCSSLTFDYSNAPPSGCINT